jgi:cytoskeletal protein CcmA (bactofilin family)
MSLFRIAPQTFRLLEQGSLAAVGGETRSAVPIQAPELVLGDASGAPLWRITPDGAAALIFAPDGAPPLLSLGNAGTVDISGAARVDGAVDVSGALRAASTLDVSGAARVDGAVDVSGALRAASTLDVSGAAHIGGAVDVSGAAHFRDRIDVSGAARIDGHVDISSGLLIKGLANFLTNVTIDGDLTVLGTQTINNTQTLEVTDSVLILNKGLETDPSPTLQAGIEINRGPMNQPYKFIFDEQTLTFQVGISGETQPVATREVTPTAHGIAIWNGDLSQLRTTSAITADATDNLLVSTQVLLGATQTPAAPLAVTRTDNGVAVWSASATSLVTDRGIFANGSGITLAKLTDVSGGLSVRGGNADISGAARIALTLDVSGASRLAGPVDISAALRLASGLDVSGAARVVGTADICGNSRIFSDLRVDGDINCGGNVTAFTTATFSDARLKSNVVPLFDEIPDTTLAALRPVAYTNRGGDRKIGFIAQEVDTVLPHVVAEDPHTGYLSLSYAELTALLAATVQRLEARLERAEKIIEANGLALPQ